MKEVGVGGSHVMCTRWVMSENRRIFVSERPDPADPETSRVG